MRHDGFGRRARLEVAAAIGETDDGVGVGDIDPLRITAGRIEGDAERSVKPVREHARRRRLAGVRPQHADTAGFAFGSEYVAVGRHANEPLMRKPGGEQGDLEARRNGRFLLLAAAHRIEKIGCRAGLIGGREVLRPDQPPRSRFIRAPIAKSGFAFEPRCTGLCKQR